MPLLTVANLTHAYGTDVVLDGATLSIEPGERIGLVGRNGCGKTTLMKVLLGDLEPDSGTVQSQRGSRAGYLSQDPSFDSGDTVRDGAEGAFEELHRLHVQLNHLFEEMADAHDDSLQRLLNRQAKLESAIEAAGGYAIDHRIDATLHGLGFADDQFGLSVEQLSGGQKGRLGLARLLLEAPDILLLDEPTNHLDIAGREWLENFLIEEYKGAVLVVSHDRWLLDRVVHRIIEIEGGSVRDYPGNYHKYLELRRERQMTQVRAHDKQLDKIRSEEQYIARYKAGQRAKQARGRLSRLERFKRDELIERPTELGVMNLRMPAAPRSGDMVITAEEITKKYGDLTLFEDFSMTVSRGDRIGIIGPNGIGKTTLIRCLVGELQQDVGTVRLGSRVSVGYYHQLHEGLDLSLNVWQYLQSVIVGLDGAAKASEQQARNLAGAFLFSGSDQDKILSDVSGGERSRAVLAGLVAGSHNLLVLDEPSNHLDIPSSERLEQVLSMEGGYEGTLLLISHDRALLETTCDRLIVFEEGTGPREFYGKYSDWAKRRKHAAAPKGSDPAAPAAALAKVKKPKSRRRGSAGDGPRGKLARMSLSKVEARIEAIQARIREIDETIILPEVYMSASKMKALQAEQAALREELEPLEFEWAARAEQS